MSRATRVVRCAVCVIGVIVIGCAQQTAPSATPIERAWEAPAKSPQPDQPAVGKPAPTAPTKPASPPPATQSAAAVPADDLLALVNGQPIRRSTVVNLVMECHGLSMLENLILLTAAKQKAAAMSISVTPADIKAAHEDALQQLAMPFVDTDRPPLDRPTAERLLQSFLAAKNISPREWDLRMEQRAYIGRIAAEEVAKSDIAEAMLRSQYEQDFGEKVQIRHIQLSSLAQVTRARALLGQKDFELVAREMSENELTASQGGLMPPFTRNDPGVPPLLRETAFSLKVGEVSTAIHEQNWYHLIKVERHFPASDVTFENADKSKLRARIIERLTRQRMEDLEVDLFRDAAVDIRDLDLSSRFRERHRTINR